MAELHGHHEAQNLLDDLRSVPSWVWLGGAAAVGLLWVMRGGSSGSTAATSGVPAPVAVGSAGDTAYGSELATLEGQLSQLLAGNGANLPAGLPGAPSGIAGAPYQLGVVIQAPAGTVPNTEFGSDQAYQQYSQANLDYISQNSFAQGIITMFNNHGPLFYATSLNPQTAKYYQYTNNAWVPSTFQQYNQFESLYGGSSGQAYTGPGTYYGTTITGAPGAVQPPAPVTGTQTQ